MLTTTTTRIGDHDYELGQFNATKSLEILYDLTKWVSGPLGRLGTSMLKGGRGAVLDTDIGDIDFGAAFEAFFQNCPRADFIAMLKTLCTTNVTRDGKKVNFDVDFQGNQEEAFLLAVEVIKFNFAGFTGALGGAFSRVKSLMSQKSTPAPATGSSGGPSLQA